MRQALTVSFIVPVRNDATRLKTCLASIDANRAVQYAIETVVLDNASADGSGEVARRHGAKVLTLDGVRVSQLRNIGAREAAGDVLAFVDADNEISSRWVQAALDTLKDQSVAAVGSHYHAPPDGTWVQKAYGLLRGSPSGTSEAEWLGSGNVAVRRSVFETVGGFDPRLETCEDVDLCQRIRARGHRIVSDSRLRNIHHGDPATLLDVFHGERWRGRDNLRVSFRRPIQWRNLPSALIPVVDTLLIATVIGALLIALAGWREALALAPLALLGIGAGSLVKVVRAAMREPLMKGSRLVQGFVVAFVYDIARAIALVTPAQHRNTRPEMKGA